MTKKIKESETRTIKRSEINFAPYNPKKHAKEDVKKMLNNFKKVAFLGGVIWNIRTGNLVDGHKRIMALDIYYNYDGDTDYHVKVEVIDVDEKIEKEQNIWQSRSRTDFDDELMRALIPDIDYKNAGLDDYDLSYYGIDLSNDVDFDLVESVEELYQPIKAQDKEIKKEEISLTPEEKKLK